MQQNPEKAEKLKMLEAISRSKIAYVQVVDYRATMAVSPRLKVTGAGFKPHGNGLIFDCDPFSIKVEIPGNRPYKLGIYVDATTEKELMFIPLSPSIKVFDVVKWERKFKIIERKD